MSDHVDMPASESYAQLKQRLAQANQTKDDVIAETGGIDLDNIPKYQDSDHIWVERGIVVSCEGAGHQPHRHFMKH